MEILDLGITSNTSHEEACRNRYQSRIFPVQSSSQKKTASRIRRNSDCCLRVVRKVPRVRRKSCDNFGYSFRESESYSGDPNDNIVSNEVESQLEKMFAGIIDGDSNVLKNKRTMNKTCIKNMITNKSLRKDLGSASSNRLKKNERNLMRESEDTIKSNSTKKCSSALSETTNKNVKKCLSYTKHRKARIHSNVKRKNKAGHSRDPSNESYNSYQVKYKGPIIQMKNVNTSSTCAEIINVPREEDEEKSRDKRRFLSAGFLGKSNRPNRHQNNIDCCGNYRNSELFISTLSSRYDACTTDSTWVCIFCKKGPHCLIESPPHFFEKLTSSKSESIPAFVLSDLFGPFSISKRSTENDCIIEFSGIEHKVTFQEKQQSKSKSNPRYTMLMSHFIAQSKKRKKNAYEEDKDCCKDTAGSNLMHNCSEVWVHEQCIIWTVGVYVTGGRINGLPDAVRDSIVSVCSICGVSGANITCFEKGCRFVVHYCCAINYGWQLNTQEYTSKCYVHKNL